MILSFKCFTKTVYILLMFFFAFFLSSCLDWFDSGRDSFVDCCLFSGIFPLQKTVSRKAAVSHPKVHVNLQKHDK